jgi:para-aminobenzoate synthetase/4-amino-4-deoxychorismate lyase
VTGAPKIAAMAKISSLEAEPRGVYCGAIGYLTPGGRAIFNVAIRTVTINRETGVAVYGVGSGVTWDSQAEAEAAEIRLKSALLAAEAAPPGLFETLRLEEGRFSRPERHIARLAASAGHLGIPHDRAAMRDALEALALGRPHGLWRARLRLTPEGDVSAESEPLADEAGSARTFRVAPEPIDREDRWLYHKVTDRSAYVRRKAACSDVDDVLMQNLEGELTEFTTGNLVLEIDGDRWTPSIECGLLPGVFRAELLETGAVCERVLTESDLARASRIWLVNSLRGWVEMRPVGLQVGLSTPTTTSA